MCRELALQPGETPPLAASVEKRKQRHSMWTKSPRFLQRENCEDGEGLRWLLSVSPVLLKGSSCENGFSWDLRWVSASVKHLDTLLLKECPISINLN